MTDAQLTADMAGYAPDSLPATTIPDVCSTFVLASSRPRFPNPTPVGKVSAQPTAGGVMSRRRGLRSTTRPLPPPAVSRLPHRGRVYKNRDPKPHRRRVIVNAP